MVEEYVEGILFQLLEKGHIETPTFTDEDLDVEYKLEARAVLRKIKKEVQNATHNKHNYIFEIVEIEKLEK